MNEYADAPRREAGQELDPYPLPESLGEHDPALTTGLTEQQLVALADRLHGFFAASSEDEVVGVLNGLLEESAPVPRGWEPTLATGHERVWARPARFAARTMAAKTKAPISPEATA